MFAYAIFDRRQQKLFLARDRLGKKPLYYGIVGGRFLLFGSELKALLAHPQLQRTLDPASVDNYLAFGYVPDPRTIYKGIYKLPPGHTLEIERGKPLPAPVRYWRPSFAERPSNEREATEILLAKLDESTRIRLMSEVPLGAFLSAASIPAASSRLWRSRAAPSKPLRWVSAKAARMSSPRRGASQNCIAPIITS